MRAAITTSSKRWAAHEVGAPSAISVIISK